MEQGKGIKRMSKIEFSYKEKARELENVRTYMDIANALTRGNHNFLVCRVNGVLKDLSAPIDANNFAIEFYNFDSPEGKEVFWHTSAHILAQAVKKLFPEARHTIGPAIEKGFYYDFDMQDYHFVPEDMEKIEKEAEQIIADDIPVIREEVGKEAALELFKDNPYKTEIIRELPDDAIISVYRQGNFADLCRGPHLASTGAVKAFKIMSFAGAYWRGDSNNKMLQRVYAVSFPDQKQLKKHLNFLEEAKKRDHRKIGKELDLFSFHEEGPGFPFWHDKGLTIFNLLLEYMREENLKRGYSEIKTPPILNNVLWERSGHWDNYKDNMYFTEIDERTFSVKPMNCPGGLLIYNNRLHSYRELPIRQAEFGLVHRHELSGVLHGLFRVRSFTQDDAHVFCTAEQLQQEIKAIVEYTLDVYSAMGFKDFNIFIATRPENSIGSQEDWETATNALIDSLNILEIPFGIKEGEGAFYGPKIEFNIQDSLERNWQCGTIQVDFSMPRRFELTYEGADGKSHQPIMLHRAILGSFERFIGILLEHYAGKLPAWLSPVQVKIINVAEPHLEYAREIETKLRNAGVRVEGDYRNESLGYRIREARNQRVPFMCVIGDQEMESGELAVRDRSNQTVSMKPDELIEKIFEMKKNRE
jgi:threonyl-tRNA synthetase